LARRGSKRTLKWVPRNSAHEVWNGVSEKGTAEEVRYVVIPAHLSLLQAPVFRPVGCSASSTNSLVWLHGVHPPAFHQASRLIQRAFGRSTFRPPPSTDLFGRLVEQFSTAAYTFVRDGAHPGPERLQLLEPAGPDELSVPHGHVRTPVAHVLVAVREEIHGLDDRHG